MKTGMIESNKYFEGLLDEIPDELLDGISDEKDFFEDGGIDLLKMVDLPLESVECGDSHHQWDAGMTGNAGVLPGQLPSHAYVDSTVWYTPPEAKPKLLPPNQSTLRPQPVSSISSAAVPVMVGNKLTGRATIAVTDTQMVSPNASVAVPMVGDKHTNHDAIAVSDAQLEAKPKLMPLASLNSKTGQISSDCSIGFPLVLEGKIIKNTASDAISDISVEPFANAVPLNGSIPKPEPVSSDTFFGLPLVLEDRVIEDTISSAVLDTLLESKPKLMPNVMDPKTQPIASDAMTSSPLVAKGMVTEYPVENAHSRTLLERKHGIPAVGNTKLLQSGSSRVQSPVSVLEAGSCNSARTGSLNLKFRGVRYGKRSKRPRPKHIKTPWFHISLSSGTASAKKTCPGRNKDKKKKIAQLPLGRTNIEDADQLAMEKLLFALPTNWNDQTSGQGSVGTKKCSHCEVTKTPQWREGPNGPKTLCNACGVRYRSGRLFPEYRPAASPTFTPMLHSNSHKKVIEMRKQAMQETFINHYPHKIVIDTMEQAMQHADTFGNPPRSPDSPLIENIPMIGRGSVGTKKCSHCEVTKTPQWREGLNGPKTLCNACGVRYRSGRLFPEYRPAASPTFTPMLHSNSHEKVIEMRKQAKRETFINHYPHKKVIDTMGQAMQYADSVSDPPRSPDSLLIENIPMVGHLYDLIY